MGQVGLTVVELLRARAVRINQVPAHANTEAEIDPQPIRVPPWLRSANVKSVGGLSPDALAHVLLAMLNDPVRVLPGLPCKTQTTCRTANQIWLGRRLHSWRKSQRHVLHGRRKPQPGGRMGIAAVTLPIFVAFFMFRRITGSRNVFV